MAVDQNTLRLPAIINLITAIKQLIEAEVTERRVLSIHYQMRIVRFPHHKDFATFDYELSAVKQTEIQQLCTGQFTKDAHNLILVGGTGTGKTHIALLWEPHSSHRVRKPASTMRLTSSTP